MKTLPLILVVSALLPACASLETVDRSLTASPLLSFTEDEQDNIAPHTGLRGGNPASSGTCTVCAH